MMGSPLTRYNLGLFNSGTYTPFICDISAISTGPTTRVTTTIDHGFVIGNEVQFFIPAYWGIHQLDLLSGYISSVPASDQFIVNINSTNFDPFMTPIPSPSVVINPAQVAGIGDSNTGNLAPGGILPVPNTVPGAFQNQPPN